MSEQVNLFGAVNDQDDSLKAKSPGGELGLNTARISLLAFVDDAGKDNAPGNAVDIHVMLGEREYRRRIFEITRVYGRDGEVIEDTESDAYKTRYKNDTLQALGMIVHAVKAVGVTQDQLNTALAGGKSGFAEWAQTVVGLIPSNYEERPVDMFLEYEWVISGDNNRTFLQLPKNMKGGNWLTASIKPVGSWSKEYKWIENDETTGAEIKMEGMRYVDDSKNVHPFVRDENFMTGNKAIQQIEGQEGASQEGEDLEVDTAKKSNW